MAEAKNGNEPPQADAKSLVAGGYNQTYIIRRTGNRQAKSDYQDNDVFFRCGNWCYVGQIQFNGLELGTSDLPVLIPALQKQQSSLRYYCNATSVPKSSEYADPLAFYNEAAEFFANEMISEAVNDEMRKMASMCPWIDGDGAQTYFELNLNEVPRCMDKVALIASKTYTRGLIIISIYCDSAMYFVIQSGEGDQPLLDVRFPDVSKHNEGILLQSYNDPAEPWSKLTLWHILNYDAPKVVQIPKLRTLSVSSSNYQQTYCVMKSTWGHNSPIVSVHHDVLFRFGSWCYAGRVQLTPTLTLSDIPFVIPALRMQQSRLDYYCDVATVPTNSPFANCLSYIQQLEPLIEREIYESEEALQGLIDRLGKMGLAETVTKWLEGDSSNSFFEFKLAPWENGKDPMKGIELVATKSYHPSGVITVTIVFQNSIYVCVLEGDKENPLLDSRFPDVSGKGRGYQIQSYDSGLRDWPEIRKVSVWQTVGALEQEFRERAAQLAQDKNTMEEREGASRDRDRPMADLDVLSDPELGLDRVRKNLSSDMKETRDPGTKQWMTGVGAGSAGGDSNRDRPEDDSAAGTPEKGPARAGVPDVAEGKDLSGSRVASRHSSKESLTRSVAPSSAAVRAGSTKDDSLEDGEGASRLRFDRPVATRADTGPMDDKASAAGIAIAIAAGSGSSRQCGGDGDGAGAAGSGPAPLLGSVAVASPTENGSSRGISSLLARPHHIPKMNDNLAKRMEDIRKTMGDGGGMDAPWDNKGRPLGRMGSGLGSSRALGSPLGSIGADAGDKK